jgi:hypothetical protein
MIGIGDETRADVVASKPTEAAEGGKGARAVVQHMFDPRRQQHLPQRDGQPAKVGIGDQPDLPAREP